MKLLLLRIQEAAKEKHVPQYIIEKDYALSYALAGIIKQRELSHSLIFKGGTALKKIFFNHYRFSEDLDFSTINAPKKTALEAALQEAIAHMRQLLNNPGFDIQIRRKAERDAHPTGQEAFEILVKFPWHPKHMCNLKIEITHDEPVILEPVYHPILHNYGEKLGGLVACYHIEEIISEKLRALLQTHQRLVLRGWNRPRARDYYDLWNVLKNYRHSIDVVRLQKTLNKKCAHRNVSYKTIDDFFTPELMNETQRHWKTTLGNMVIGLVDCDTVLNETKRLVEALLDFR